MINLKPLGPRAVVKRLEEPARKSAILEVIEFVKQDSPFAVVLGVGQLAQGGFDIGDTVILRGLCGSPVTVTLDGVEIDAFMVMEDDVLAVMEEGEQQ